MSGKYHGKVMFFRRIVWTPNYWFNPTPLNPPPQKIIRTAIFLRSQYAQVDMLVLQCHCIPVSYCSRNFFNTVFILEYIFYLFKSFDKTVCLTISLFLIKKCSFFAYTCYFFLEKIRVGSRVCTHCQTSHSCLLSPTGPLFTDKMGVLFWKDRYYRGHKPNVFHLPGNNISWLTVRTVVWYYTSLVMHFYIFSSTILHCPFLPRNSVHHKNYAAHGLCFRLVWYW